MINSPNSHALRAVASATRLQILQWILDPMRYFPPQNGGDLVEDGVCVGFIAQKTGLRQPTVTAHMKVLAEANLVTQKKIKNWVFYKPNPMEMAQLIGDLSRVLKVKD